jgi:hypothetical protein
VACMRSACMHAPSLHAESTVHPAAYRRAANEAANNGKERKDLYTENWDGSEWKGKGFNILQVRGWEPPCPVVC